MRSDENDDSTSIDHSRLERGLRDLGVDDGIDMRDAFALIAASNSPHAVRDDDTANDGRDHPAQNVTPFLPEPPSTAQLETIIRAARLRWNAHRNRPLDAAIAEAIANHLNPPTLALAAGIDQEVADAQ